MANSSTLQDALLNHIVARFPKKSEAIVELMETLSLNRDGIYRRLRGDTMLTAAEIERLAVHFDLSLDELLTRRNNKVIFSYNLYDRKITRFLQYLEQVYEPMLEFKRYPGFRMFYSSREVPIYFYMMFPKLLTFKLFVYGLTTWEMEHLKKRKFGFDLLDLQEEEMARATARHYCSIESTDFWPSTILEQTLSQVEYMAYEGRFETIETAREICREILVMVEHSQAMAEVGRKFLPGQNPIEENGRFNLFYNELYGTNNTILSMTDVHYGLFTTFDTPNFLYTSDQRICQSMERWFGNLTRNSVSISQGAGSNRNFYFKRLNEKVQQSLKRLDLIYETY